MLNCGTVARRSRDGGIDQLRRKGHPSVSFADSIPQFSMVVPLRSQARLRHSLLHWAYFGLFRALRAAFVRPAKNARNDVHAVISDLSFVLPILCQGSAPYEFRFPAAFRALKP